MSPARNIRKIGGCAWGRAGSGGSGTRWSTVAQLHLGPIWGPFGPEQADMGGPGEPGASQEGEDEDEEDDDGDNDDVEDQETEGRGQ